MDVIRGQMTLCFFSLSLKYRILSLWRLCFYTCLSVHRRGWWYPSMPCRSPGGVSRPTSRGEEVEGNGQGSLQAHTWGGSCVSQHALRQTPRRQLLPRAVRILLECILVTNVFNYRKYFLVESGAYLINQSDFAYSFFMNRIQTHLVLFRIKSTGSEKQQKRKVRVATLFLCNILGKLNFTCYVKKGSLIKELWSRAESYDHMWLK